MKTTLKFLSLLLVTVLFSYNVSAQGLIDSTMGMSMGAGNELSSAAKAPPPPSMIINGLERQGFTNISDLAPTPMGQPMQATATSPAGIPVNLMIDPVTGKLLSATPR